MAQKIFISYAHVDDAPDPEAEKGWVSTLVDFLNARLPPKIGRAENLDIWKDDRLSRHEPLTELLREEIASSSVFLMIASEGYLDSEWCTNKELPQFIRQHLGHRIFRIERDQIDRGRLPEQLRDVIGYKFWSEDPQSKVRRALIGVPRKFADEQFFSMLDILVHQLAELLKKLANPPPGNGAAAVQAAGLLPPAPAGPAVFLASAANELDGECSRTQTYLREAGLRVLTPELLPFERAACVAALEAMLRECVLFVQLLAPAPPAALPEDAASDAGLQLQVAQRLGKTVLQWRNPAMNLAAVADAAHRAMLEGGTVEPMGIEDFKALVVKRALAKTAAEPPRKPVPPGSPIEGFIFLNRAVEDREAALPIEQLLRELNVACIVPLESGDPGAVRIDLEENLRDCDGLIIVYGSTSAGWVRQQVRQYRRAKRVLPLRAQGIYDGPPAQKDELGVVLPGLEIINCRGGFDPGKLRHFLIPE